ncbi:histidine phosphatase family protein [Bacillus testis]|uniref:histidine phosphatase family protein n=1 Tax=Bacillus testis TaxID=1622072 RepID=UPI00084121A5|nr:phosphoglycerate mutase family protein [Bacillus testis]
MEKRQLPGTISLIRHGESSCSPLKKADARQYAAWLDDYDRKGIQLPEEMASESREALLQADVLISSDLKRAVESAAYLHPQANVQRDSRLREVRIPSPAFSFFGCRMGTNRWNVIMRLAWIAGYSGKEESFKQAKCRSQSIAQHLAALASSGNVAVVGHGFFNRMIAKELRKNGWQPVGKHGDGNWACSVYEWAIK